MTRSPIVRATLALVRDARGALVALAVTAAVVGGVAVLHHHVRVRAWVAVLIVGALLLALLVVDTMRARERDRATRLEGALDRAEQRAGETDQSIERQPNAGAREVIRGIESLRSTLNNRVSPYAATAGIEARYDELERYNLVARRVGALIQPPQELRRLLGTLPIQPGAPQEVDGLLSGLDLMESEVTTWGLNHPDPG